MATEKSEVVVKRDISENVLIRVKQLEQAGELKLPKNYIVENALKSAYIVLSETKDRNNKSVLTSCTQQSIAESLLKMVVWGLSPLKKQCYFIPYGDKLECVPDYSGNILMAKRFGNVSDVIPNVVLEGDEFEFEIDVESGRKRVIKHKQSLESIGKNIVKGAYATIKFNDGTYDTEIMSMSQINSAWTQRGGGTLSPAHKKFPDQMAKKTVINRACKLIIRGSDDSALFVSDETEEADQDKVKDGVTAEIEQEANKVNLNFDDVDYENVEEEVKEEVEEEEEEVKPAKEEVKQEPKSKTKESKQSNEPEMEF